MFRASAPAADPDGAAADDLEGRPGVLQECMLLF